MEITKSKENVLEENVLEENVLEENVLEENVPKKSVFLAKSAEAFPIYGGDG